MALKLYTVVRDDLGHGDQAAQSAHALAALALDYPKEFEDWGNQTLVLLQAPIHQIRKLIEASNDGGIKYATFTEPDYRWFRGSSGPWYQQNHELTAVSFLPNWSVQHVLVKDLPLALTEVKQKKGWFNW